MCILFSVRIIFPLLKKKGIKSSKIFNIIVKPFSHNCWKMPFLNTITDKRNYELHHAIEMLWYMLYYWEVWDLAVTLN